MAKIKKVKSPKIKASKVSFSKIPKVKVGKGSKTPSAPRVGSLKGKKAYSSYE